MIGYSIRPLLYPLTLAQGEVEQLVLEAFATGFAPPPADIVTFDALDGGQAERRLAIPRIAGMDAVEVQSAGLTLTGQAMTFTEPTPAKTASSGGGDTGIVLSLGRQARWKRIILRYPSFPDSVVNAAERYSMLGGAIVSRDDDAGPIVGLKVVVRLGLPDGSFGPPAYSMPNFALESPMYDRLLAGAVLRDLGNGKIRIALPSVPAERLLIQLAVGDSPDQLTPIGFDAELVEIESEAVPEGVSVSLRDAAGGGDVVLFDHPPAMLPSAGSRDVDFRPLAERTLAEALADASGDATLGLTLDIRATRPGKLALGATRLAARYRIDALAGDRLTMDGGFRPLGIPAAAGRQPAGGSMTLTAIMAGERLNAATPDPSPVPDGGGLVVSTGRHAAAPVVFADTGQPLLAIRLRLTATAPSEISITLRADAAGLPGAAIASPLTAQLAPGAGGWIGFTLPAPLWTSGPLWVTARMTTGRAFWFTRPAGAAASDTRPGRISTDTGTSWGTSTAALAQPTQPEVQLIESAPEPVAAPALRLVAGDSAVALAAPGDWLSPGQREYRIEGRDLPASLMSLLGNRPGDGRVALQTGLFTRDLCRLTVDALTLYYDPSAPPGSALGAAASEGSAAA